MYKYVGLIILVCILYILTKKNKDFYTDYLQSPIYTENNNPIWSGGVNDADDPIYFKNLIKNTDLTITNYANLYTNEVPELIFESWSACPNLYNLFNNLINDTLEGEGQEGIKFRNDCEKLFYNSSFFIRIEHPIIKIKRDDIKDDISPSPSVNSSIQNGQDFKFVIDGTHDLKYNKEKKDGGGEFCNDEMGIKQINFGVKSDFTMEDIFRFVDFGYTQLCFGMIYIEHMKLLSNHYRVLPCPNEKGSFFILPERIRHQVSKEGKYYTRAKCTSCSLNIIVLFGTHFPEKFDYIYKSGTICQSPSLYNN